MSTSIQNLRKQKLFIVILGTLTMLGPLAIDLYLPALPNIARSFNVPLNYVQYTITAYIITFALGPLIYGPLSDQYGRKKILIFGLVIYCLSNIYAALSPTINHLILARILQAIGASAILNNISSIVLDVFTGKDNSRALSSVFLVMTVAPLIAPLAGGQIIKYWHHWQVLFVILAVLSAITLLLALWKIPETLPPENRLNPSIKDLICSYKQILTHKYAMGCMLSNAFIFAGMFTFITASPHVYIELYHISSQNYGFVFAANIIALTIMNRGNIILLRYCSMLKILYIGSIGAAISGIVLITSATIDQENLAAIMIPIICFVGMLSLTGPNANTLSVACFQKTAGTANAIGSTIRFGLSSIASLMVSLFHTESALQMATIMASCGVLSLLCLLCMVNNKQPYAIKTP